MEKKHKIILLSLLGLGVIVSIGFIFKSPIKSALGINSGSGNTGPNNNPGTARVIPDRAKLDNVDLTNREETASSNRNLSATLTAGH